MGSNFHTPHQVVPSWNHWQLMLSRGWFLRVALKVQKELGLVFLIVSSEMSRRETQALGEAHKLFPGRAMPSLLRPDSWPPRRLLSGAVLCSMILSRFYCTVHPVFPPQTKAFHLS